MTPDRLIFILACIGALSLTYHACRGVEGFGMRVERRLAERKRRRPVVVIAPLPRVVAVPAATRRKHSAIWPSN